MFKKMKEFFQLLGLNIIVAQRDAVEFLRVVWRYYSKMTFLRVDVSLMLKYLFCSPFRVSKRYLMSKGEKDIYTYGETPLTTMEKIAEECGIKDADVVFELGCGRGRICFWLNTFIGCQVVGIDRVPLFIANAREVKKRWHVTGVQFRHEDILNSDLDGATVLYLYGTSLSDQDITTLAKNFAQLPQGTRIITVSYALSEYVGEDDFEIMRLFPVRFPWGQTDVYLQVRK